MAQKRGLNRERGMNSLLGFNGNQKTEQVPKEEKHVSKEEGGQEVFLNINEIEPNRNQPRKQFNEDAIDELADSIKKYGVIQPLIVQKKNDYYEIIAGERRWRACKKAGVQEVPVIIRKYDDEATLKISLIENLQREDLNPIEEGKAYQQLQKEFGLKQDEIAESISKSRTAVTNTMRLLKLDERVQDMIIQNIINEGQGRTLLAIKDKDEQYKLAHRILDENLTVREVEKLVKSIQNAQQDTAQNAKDTESAEMSEQIQLQYASFENRLKDILGSKVSIKKGKNHKGKIEIAYYSEDELERIIDLIQSIPSK